MDKRINLVSDTIGKSDIDSLVGWLSQDPTPRLTKGPLTPQLEQKWANKIGTKYSVFVNSGSSAILLSLAAAIHTNRLKNNKIVVPGLSWATDLSSPMILGMQPILCDCNLTDLSFDLDQLEEIFKREAIGSILLVSPLGFVPNMDEIVHLCKVYGVVIFEDICESMGSKYHGKYLGSFGFASFFSLYFGHHLSTIEGGFINTDDEDFYHALVMMRSHGWDRDLPEPKKHQLRTKYNISEFDSLYNFYLPGFNVRSTDIQAFLGLIQIDKLDDFSKKRNYNYHLYLNHIDVNEFKFKQDTINFTSNFAYPILSEYKQHIVAALLKDGIEVRPLIAGDMSQKPVYYEKYGHKFLPNCSNINDHGFYIPNHQDLSVEDVLRISRIINENGKD